MATKKQTKEIEVSIVELYQGEVKFKLKGTSPLIYHRMSEKVKQELLFPKGRKTAAEKATSLKHNPLEEYRDSVYRSKTRDTLLMAPSIWFKGAIQNAALDIPGATKSQMGRLVWVDGDQIPLYGIPELLMSVTRSSDMNRTPDIRTRAIVPEWVCDITVRFIRPNISEQAVINLLGAAGVITGVGDYRAQKGKSSYGQFTMVSASDADYKRIKKNGGRKAQLEAIETPSFYDYDTEELYSWFYDEYKKRRGSAEMLQLIEGTVA